jgi:exoribonuclease R
MIGIADVDAFVAKDIPIDQHASEGDDFGLYRRDIFPMLPNELSTGASSLLPDVDRPAVVTEFVVNASGALKSSNVYRAIVRNKAQLTYNAIGAWLEGTAAAPPKVAASAELQAQLKLQDEVAQALRKLRYANGALNIDTAETVPLLLNQQVTGVATVEKNRATELIEDFMIAANGVVARCWKSFFLAPHRKNSRALGRPRAAGGGARSKRDPARTGRFQGAQRFSGEAQSRRSRSLCRLVARGDQADWAGRICAGASGRSRAGHFGLAVQDYTHSTAPNRRFADVVTQRLIKALLDGKPGPYSDDELAASPRTAREKGDAARKVEREMSKRLAAVAMSHRIGETFDAMVTGVTPKGTFVRVMQPHIEGLLAQGGAGLARRRQKLTRTEADADNVMRSAGSVCITDFAH